MKKLNTLSLYRDTFEFLNTITKYVSNFPKAYKYNIGDRLMDSALELMKTLSLSAIYGENKYIGEYIINFQLTKTLIRLCNENHIIDVDLTTLLAIRMEAIDAEIEKIVTKIKSQN